MGEVWCRCSDAMADATARRDFFQLKWPIFWPAVKYQEMPPLDIHQISRNIPYGYIHQISFKSCLLWQGLSFSDAFFC